MINLKNCGKKNEHKQKPSSSSAAVSSCNEIVRLSLASVPSRHAREKGKVEALAADIAGKV
jgi:hypothetical protein